MDSEELASKIYEVMVTSDIDSWNCLEIRDVFNVDNLDIEDACDEDGLLEMVQICGNYHVIRG